MKEAINLTEGWTVQNHSTVLNGQIMNSLFKIQGHAGSGLYSSFFALSLLQSFFYFLFFRIFQKLFPQYMICLDFWLVGVWTCRWNHLSVKQGSLFQWDPPNRDASDRVLGLFGKLSRRRAASAWFHVIWICSAKVLEYWMISSNRSWNFWRNWTFGVVEKILMSRI